MVNQTIFLMRKLLSLRSWRFLFILLIMALMLFGIQCCYALSKFFIKNKMNNKMRVINAKYFQNTSTYIIGNRKVFDQEFAALVNIFEVLDTPNRSSLYGHCETSEECLSQMFNSMVFNEDTKLRYYADYRNAIAWCQATYVSMINCVFFWSLATLSGMSTKESKYWFKKHHIFELTALPNDTETKQATSSSTVCATEMSFFLTLPQLLTWEMAVLTPTICAYLLIATVSCMIELKSRGFLQLMIRKGLSPFSYWRSVWLITSFELLLLTGCFAASFYLQCPGFYSLPRLLYSTLIIGAYLFCLAALVLLFTVLSNDYYTICKCVFILIIIIVLVTIGNRMAQEQEHNRFGLLNSLLLSIPCANIAELLHANFIGQISPSIEANLHTTGLIINGSVLAITFLITLYLDHVLKTGNSLCYSGGYLFGLVPGVEALPNIENTQPCVEAANLTVFMQVANISQKVLNANGESVDGQGSISVNIYDEQITAVYGNDSTTTGSFLGALTGRVPVSSGHVWMDGCISTNSMARPYSHINVGECLQENTLCHSLTVMETLRTALVSNDCTWEDYEREINKVMSLLQLLDKLPCKVESLSCGQKRKLCVAVALLGNPRLIILNDPTRSLDPLSRIRLWRLLQDYRFNKCVIVSTQFIDDTDLFADRKIFLSSVGHLMCAGSSAFIRRGLSCGLVIEATLRDKKQSKAVMMRLQSDLPSGVRAVVQESLLSVQLAYGEANLVPSVIKSFNSIRKEVSWVGVNNPSLSEAYKRLKSMDAVEVDSLYRSLQGDAAIDENIKMEDGDNYPASQDIIVESDMSREGVQPELQGDKGEDTKEQADQNSQNAIDVNAINDPTFGDSQVERKEVHNTRSQASCMGATMGIFCLNCLLVRRNSCKLFSRIFLPIFLLTFYAFMLVTEKKLITLKTKAFTNFSSMASKKVSRGICISDYDIFEVHKTNETKCRIFFTGAKAIGGNFLSIHKFRRTLLYAFLSSPIQIKKFYKFCAKSKPDDLPCPIVYANNWDSSSSNVKRQISIGSYGPFLQYDPELAAATTLKAFQIAMHYFSRGSLGSFKLAAILDFRTAFLPLYGVFTHIFIFIVFPVLYMDDIMEHKESKWRCYLISMGVSTLGYWASTLLIHWLQYAFLYCLMVGLGAIINPSIYTTDQQAVVAGLTITCGLMNNLLVSYLLCILFSCSRRTFFVLFLLFSIAISIATICIHSINIFSIILITALPQFASSTLALFSVRFHVYSTELYANGGNIGMPKFYIPYQRDHFMYCLMVIPSQTVALIILLIVAERTRTLFGCCGAPCKCDRKDKSTKGIVATNDLLMNEFDAQSDESDAVGSVSLTRTVDMKRARKVYRYHKKAAVQAIRNLTLSVESGETLGLVGPNGSGVTTALSIIIGKLLPTSGMCEVAANGSRLSHRRISSTGMVAYSPQCNPLFANVTANEHARNYARMLGATRHKVHKLLRDIGLNDVKHRPVWQLSEGQKRRLSLAISLLSSSPLLVIDDASTGIHSGDVPHLWKAIAQRSSKYISAIISANSLEGTEAACSKVALINCGRVAAIGTVHQLRRRYGIYTLEVELESETIEMAQDKKAAFLKAIVRRFFSSEILDQSLNWMKISIPLKSVGHPLDSLSWLLKMKDDLAISDLRFYPATTDQILEFIFKNHDAKIQKLRPCNMKNDDLTSAPLTEFYDL